MVNFFCACLIFGIGLIVGTIVGIKDCKKKFGIPKGEMPCD